MIGVSRTAVIGKRINSPNPSEPRLAVGIAGPSVEGIATVSTDAQGVATVAVTQMVPETKALKARVKARRAVTQGARARAESWGTLFSCHHCGPGP